MGAVSGYSKKPLQAQSRKLSHHDTALTFYHLPSQVAVGAHRGGEARAAAAQACKQAERER